MPPDPLIGRTLAGFRVEALIGRGGMSRVYRAEQLSLGRTVALKILAPELAEDPSFRSRFLAESRLASSIEHPNLLPVYDAGEAEGHLYIAMRLVEGTDLGRLLAAQGPLAPERALALISQAAAALDAAHARGLVHRDVKPANLLLAEGDHLYLADFGVAKPSSARRDLTRTGVFVGTLDYASPEQIRNDPLDGRSDLYSLGCVLYQCLTGAVPFDRPSEYAAMRAHLEDPPPQPSSYGLPPALDPVIATALAKEKDERYRSGRHLVEAARAALASPVSIVAPTVVAAPIAAVAPTVVERKSAEPPPTLPLAAPGGLPWARIAVGALVLALVGGAAVAGTTGTPIPSPSRTGTEGAIPTAVYVSTYRAHDISRSRFAIGVLSLPLPERVRLIDASGAVLVSADFVATASTDCEGRAYVGGADILAPASLSAGTVSVWVGSATGGKWVPVRAEVSSAGSWTPVLLVDTRCGLIE